MHPVRKQRLMIVAFILVFASLAAGLVSYALRGNINLFFPPADIIAGKAPLGQSIRLGGMVVEGRGMPTTPTHREAPHAA